MTKRQRIIEMISGRPTSRMKFITTKSRPPEKSNKILVTKVFGHNWYCERPTYFWSKFDLDFIEKGFLGEQKLLFPKVNESLVVFDKRGLFWSRYEMSSMGLLNYFLKNPLSYLEAMSTHHHDVKEVIKNLKAIRKIIKDDHFLKKNLKVFTKIYNHFCRFQSTVYLVFDEMAWQFRQFLRQHLPKALANVYFTNFLQGEMTKEALKLGYIKERGILEWVKTRGILYGMDLPPRLFYKPPKFFTEYPEDLQIISYLVEKGLSNEELRKFLAFRVIVPIGFQISEESQYIETSLLSAHLGIMVKLIAKKLNKSIDDLQKLRAEQIINLL